MNSSINSLLAKIMPFIWIGIFIVILVVAFVLLSYVLLVGAIIGLLLFVVGYIKHTFFSGKSKKSVVVTKKLPQTFDNDDFK